MTDRNAQRERVARLTRPCPCPSSKCLGNLSGLDVRTLQMNRYQLGRHSGTERETYGRSVGICRVGRVGSVVTHGIKLHEVGVPSAPQSVMMPTFTTGQPHNTRDRTCTPPLHPPTPMGGPKAVNDYILPYVWNFLDRCVDITRLFLGLFPGWGLLCS